MSFVIPAVNGGPEPILTCVQCQEEYKQSENVEGQCKFHPSLMERANWDYM